MSPPAENWASQIRAGDVRAISRAVTAIENGETAAQNLLRELFPTTGRAWRIGVTGAAGTGKSTLVNGLTAHFRAAGRTVGVIAIDPSSPFTGGAILGDRIRMQAHSTDKGVFIRSMASRGAWGGLAQAAADVALLLDASGKEVIILETVGVGQDEIDIVSVADCTIVVVVPGAGDEVQALKAGILEIADIFVLNKADYDKGDEFAQHIQGMLSLGPQRGDGSPKVIRTVATEGKGIEDLAVEIGRFREAHSAAQVRRKREIEYWKNWLARSVEQRVAEKIAAQAATNPSFDKMASAIAARQKNPYDAADELFAALGFGQRKHTQ
ncbi:MAG TPA: methylmalonyl Co-A mutase-associated GTPase MeaB [Candidatus Acidoferrum sp.]|jgi:LAO/AO transport system kinase|nr:methylmalonyl Co-A mutase-associated GTPase MeaB [Candidatus Acidoferrum sp.]